MRRCRLRSSHRPPRCRWRRSFRARWRMSLGARASASAGDECAQLSPHGGRAARRGTLSCPHCRCCGRCAARCMTLMRRRRPSSGHELALHSTCIPLCIDTIGRPEPSASRKRNGNTSCSLLSLGCGCLLLSASCCLRSAHRACLAWWCAECEAVAVRLYIYSGRGHAPWHRSAPQRV
jgi:hypothetical protein